MKLRNKLVPLASCLAIGATVAPISLTSCASSISFVDLKNGFKPTIDKAKPVGELSTLTPDEALDVYTKAVIANNEVFYQDFYWSTASALHCVEVNPNGIAHDTNYQSTIDSVKANISNVKFGSTTIGDKSIPTISFKLVQEQQVSYKTDHSDKEECTGITKYEFEITNVPFEIFKVDSESFVGVDDWIAALGRSYYMNNAIMSDKYGLPGKWALSLKLGGEEFSVMEAMKDAWSINYTLTMDDKFTSYMGDIPEYTTDKETYSWNAKTHYDLINASSFVQMALRQWKVKLYHLSDIGYNPGE